MSPLLHFVVDGPEDAPSLLLGPSLGTSLAVWDAQVSALARYYRVVRWDLPGHGGSAADLVGAGATVADLADLVLAVADRLGLARFGYAGISIGGAVGAELAVSHPERIDSLTLICSSARFGDPQGWRDRAAQVRGAGTGALAASAAGRWFAPAFADAETIAALVGDQRAADPEGYAACCDALAGYDLRAELDRISAPTLVIAGRQDIATPPSHARELVDGIHGAGLVEIPGAAHLAPVEQPGAVLDALLSHFGRPQSADAARHAAGMAVRRAVLGDAHVDRAVAGTTALTADFQDFITRYAWGEIWTRPGLDRRTRSCITLTALVAGGHHAELAMHVRAAVRNGLSAEEIGEVLLQIAVYCGVPAANAAFAVANKVLYSEDDDKDGH
ncbi:bifunctional 3-oxoadipate enol-lactonase/4-carboxymuconolactone decarboxylase PcaDC [Catenulispora rubra]|uniref:bifunctional 3-oxoadipate enol-lactonase/4-carboxymuconolactone decarboxylase PcaDC n=1 Tax=Catenulispora rubra TaxID=280293 RepID=UPI00189265FB|nr:3-oxoadipate enol-lactonase [Catenulispora rubra]